MSAMHSSDAETFTPTAANALETNRLGKRYGRTWALRDCAFALPIGRIAALVGPNGAGKTTLLHLAAGLLAPTEGEARVFGASPRATSSQSLARIGFVAQDHPLYRSFSVKDTLTLGRKLNPRWDQALATSWLAQLHIPLDRAVGKLSGGQQAQVALILALAKLPDLLLLDEPLASLDPLARRDFLRVLMDVAAAHGLTVLLSSHIITDLERVCDYAIILSAAHVQLAGDIEEIVRGHKLLVGSRQSADAVASVHTVIEEHHTARQSTLLIRTSGPILGSAWEVRDVSLEEIVLAYLGQSSERQRVATAQREMEVTQ